MPRRKNGQLNLSKRIDRKKQFEDLPKKTMKVTIYALRWVFLLIFLFIIVGIFILFFTGGENYIQQIIGFGITGFFTFFMGYFGWVLAQGTIEMITGKVSKEEQRLFYYSYNKKRNKY